MSKFIVLNNMNSNKPFTININHIVIIYPENEVNSCSILTSLNNKLIPVVELFNEVNDLIYDITDTPQL